MQENSYIQYERKKKIKKRMVAFTLTLVLHILAFIIYIWGK